MAGHGREKLLRATEILGSDFFSNVVEAMIHVKCGTLMPRSII